MTATVSPSRPVYPTYAAMADELLYRALLEVGAPLGPEAWERGRRDPLLAATLWQTRCPAFVEHFDHEAERIGKGAEKALGRRQRRLLGLALGRDDRFSGDSLRALMENELLFLVAVEHGGEAFFEALGKCFSMPGAVARVLLVQDWKVFRWLLNGNGNPSRVEDFATRAGSRLHVHRKNHKVLASVTKDLEVPKRAYFDVGCLFGLTLVSAVRLGFPVVHGCELDEKVFKRARSVVPLAATRPGLDVQYFEEDFLTLPLEAQRYTFVTVNNVLEHTPDLGDTIAKLAEILAPDGLCYIYQGNAKSPQFVRVEPHYKLPLLTILPKDLAIQILLRLGRIATPADYVVTRWPGYRELKDLFAKHGLEATIHTRSLGYWASSEISTAYRVRCIRKKIVEEAEAKVYPVLDDAEQKQAKDALAAYFAELDEAGRRDTLDDQLAYLKPTWDITVRRAGT